MICCDTLTLVLHPQALKRLRATFGWRAKEQPQSLSCTVCEKDPTAHFMHVVRLCWCVHF